MKIQTLPNSRRKGDSDFPQQTALLCRAASSMCRYYGYPVSHRDQAPQGLMLVYRAHWSGRFEPVVATADFESSALFAPPPPLAAGPGAVQQLAAAVVLLLLLAALVVELAVELAAGAELLVAVAAAPPVLLVAAALGVPLADEAVLVA